MPAPAPAPLQVPPLERPVEAVWRVPGSKSITNRALVLAALAEGRSLLSNVLHSDDTRHMRTCLEALGIGIEELGGVAPGDAATLVVDGGRSRLRAPAAALFVGNSGTTVRFLAALATLVPGAVELVGDQHMAKRPLQDLTDALAALGVRVDCPTGCPPLVVHGGRLPGGRVSMRGDRSSQYFSALLMAGGLAERDLLVEVVGELVSRPYVEMTVRMVADFGGAIEHMAGGFVARARDGYRARSYLIEPDASSASYAFAAAAATGSRILVNALDRTSLQGDYAFVDVLAEAGVEVVAVGGHTTVTGGGRLRGIEVDMHHISDTAMTLAAIAPLCDGPTTIRNIANIRIKECDRLLATVDGLRRLGQEVEHGDDWLRIHPRPVRPATIACQGDHRIAMSFAILGLARPGVTIDDPDCTAKTYPGFWQDLARLRAAQPLPPSAARAGW